MQQLLGAYAFPPGRVPDIAPLNFTVFRTREITAAQLYTGREEQDAVLAVVPSLAVAGRHGFQYRTRMLNDLDRAEVDGLIQEGLQLTRRDSAATLDCQAAQEQDQDEPTLHQHSPLRCQSSPASQSALRR